MYLLIPARSQLTKNVSELSPPPPWRFSARVQSKAAYAFDTSIGTPAIEVAVSVIAVGAALPSTKTGRKRNSAV